MGKKTSHFNTWDEQMRAFDQTGKTSAKTIKFVVMNATV